MAKTRIKPEVETFTGPQIEKTVEAVKKDLTNAVEFLTKGWAIICAVETASKGSFDGVSASCVPWRNQLEKMLDEMVEERDAVERRGLGNGKAPITESVDLKLAEDVSAARETVTEVVGA